ncbi:hypothetical protein BpHYR1_011625 [Brachionus plicatilis]|uniref:HTH psq-type domain-containing protein n=1 Tax=Brachionus plicatilis TaxID=10195 RepID=A0A3M7SRY7_BRAPC|nr:hypothetical protein BpHYR1_011625 [Brachionus plicatilis]
MLEINCKSSFLWYSDSNDLIIYFFNFNEYNYLIPKPHKNASKKVIDTPIAKRKKVVLNFVQREEIITKKKNGYCPKKLALDYMVGLSTIYDIIAKGSAELSKFRTDNPDCAIRCIF